MINYHFWQFLFLFYQEYKIPYQILEEGILLEKKGKTQNALDLYQYALTKQFELYAYLKSLL